MTTRGTDSMSRRRLLQTAAAAGATWSLSEQLLAAAAELPLVTKPIPATGEPLPVVGLGTIWYRDAQYASLLPVIRRLPEIGGTLIDTAAAYGESEGVVGRALAESGLRPRVFIATKFAAGNAGPTPPAAAAPGVSPPAAPRNVGIPGLPGPPAGVTRPDPDGVGGAASFERSLKRLQTDRIDLLQVHGMNGSDELMPLLLDWKRSGRIRYIGVTTSSPQQHPQVVETMRKYPLDFVQVDYSIGNRSAEAAVLPTAIERKVAILVNLPLGRTTLLQKLADRPLPAWAADIDVASWAQFLLKYVVSHPGVTCAIPGTTNVRHLEDNLRAARGRMPDAATRRKMEELWTGVG